MKILKAGMYILYIYHFKSTARVVPLTSILAAMARSWQILTTSWQPWIP